MCWLLLAFEFFNERVVEPVQTEWFYVVVLVHELDATSYLVDNLLLRVILRSEETL